ncbi:RNA polymerase sigma factor [Flavihumibacter petaseus]|uniref:Putative RNA polymerase ECF-type sigma factor n=1 Tax=Flavihumibacter petaseus NBRC 106054 TaxID=1220578 RepID=A0A0E9N145_9BACT|nr:sigma-70 family RNA polymerase sigma factor [Flavihumibacter petaseus]GAO43070.1 putative RNA polymerase ECF-type sigma factor [Flavihumibacter petaseus NBRC 106054]
MLETAAEHIEPELLRQLKAGSEAAFTRIYHLYWERLFFMAHKRLGMREDAREVVQNIFLTLWQKKESLDIQSLPLYLGAMTRYAVYRHLANEKRRESHLKHLQNKQARFVAETIDLENKQLIEILTRLSNDLPEKYRVVFIHHKLLDQPLEDVAARLGVSPRTAEAYVARVMAIMRQQMQKLAYAIFIF